MKHKNKGVILIDNINDSSIKIVDPAKLKYNEKISEIVSKTNKDSIYSISHSQDFDGVASSAIIIKNFKIKKENLFFINYNANDVESASRYLKGKISNGIVIVTDISMNDYLVSKFKKLIKIIKSSNSKIIWLDHHPWSEYAIKELSPLFDFGIIGENRLYCAAEIAHIIFSKNSNGSSKNLAERAHVTDFNIKKSYKNEPNISFAINYFNFDRNRFMDNLRTIANEASKNNYNAAIIKKAATNYNKEFDSNMNNVINNIILKDLKGHKIAFGFGRSFNSTQICANISNSVKADLIVYLKTDAHTGTLRRNCDSINCSLIANALDGGGHEFAAGFPIPKKYNINSKNGVNAMIKYFLKNAQHVIN